MGNQTFIGLTGLARRAELHKSTVLRLLANRVIEANGYLVVGGASVPLFTVDRVSDIKRAANVGRSS